MTVHALTSKTFDHIVETHSVVVIDFWATFCGPCKSFSKAMQQVSTEFPNVYFASVDVEAEKSLAEEFSILTLPSIMILRDQVIVYAESGALTEGALRDLVVQASALQLHK